MVYNAAGKSCTKCNSWQRQIMPQANHARSAIRGNAKSCRRQIMHEVQFMATPNHAAGKSCTKCNSWQRQIMPQANQLLIDSDAVMNCAISA
jgi:bacterioferritin-associated ferredoxin